MTKEMNGQKEGTSPKTIEQHCTSLFFTERNLEACKHLTLTTSFAENQTICTFILCKCL